MRVVNGSLVVYLSEYLPLISVCILLIKVQGFVSRIYRRILRKVK